MTTVNEEVSQEAVQQATGEEAGVEEAITLEERLTAIENQCYFMYLQLGSVTKLLLEKEIITQDAMKQNMDELNKELFELTSEMMKEKSQ
jgi:hypothetical protein